MRYRRSSRSSEDFSDVNTDISDNFESTLNVRVGGEVKVTPQFSLRGGYEWYPNAQIVTNSDSYYYPVALDNSTVWAAGLGYASNGFFTDVTFRNVTDKYSMNEIQPNFQNMDLKNSNNKVMLTVGFKF
jgi:long-subunit fatty acid transport protein